jgi:hypothetical protein
MDKQRQGLFDHWASNYGPEANRMSSLLLAMMKFWAALSGGLEYRLAPPDTRLAPGYRWRTAFLQASRLSR